jgi:DNA-binding XRE family transcriptional regulator
MNLFEARAKKRKTQWDLRQETGIHQSKISLIEHGYVEPSEKEKAAIAKALGLSVADIDWSEVGTLRHQFNRS